ncbi:MAG: radical SAM protein, partial [Victivallaceae bacterium]|nr:radical SAM protein [Victivallaceae bacterium]
MPKSAIITLGCRVNGADTALLTDRLERAGYEVTEFPAADTDLVIVNTCAVTAEAVGKSRQAVRRARRQAPSARIAALGCAAVADAENLLAAGADIVRDNFYKVQAPFFGDEPAVFGKVFRENALSRFPFRTRAFIKIQEGCDNFCTYCIVPLVRGRERSRDFAEVMEECRRAVGEGFPEIVLSGVNLCAYADGEKRLAALVGAVAALPGDFRVRIGSAEPRFDQMPLLDAMAGNP